MIGWYYDVAGPRGSGQSLGRADRRLRRRWIVYVPRWSLLQMIKIDEEAKHDMIPLV